MWSMRLLYNARTSGCCRQCYSGTEASNGTIEAQAVPCRRLRDGRRNLHLGIAKIGKTKRLSPVRRRCVPRCAPRTRVSVSCPTLAVENRPKIRVSLRHFSPPPLAKLACSVQSPTTFAFYTPLLQRSQVMTASKRSFSAKPCPFPCGPCGCAKGCNCLPPPCNTPPRCIQYMTGYYYYPYGTWFCGPYHVSGTCCPVGPCGPGSCGPCGPCGPCSPCGPCAPCGPCLKCACPSAVCPGSIPPTVCTTAMNPMSDMNKAPLRDIPRTGVMPGNQIKSPLSKDESCRQASKTDVSKSGISRFFPYDNKTTNATRPAGTPKNLPTTTIITSCSCPYSTQAGLHCKTAQFSDPKMNLPKSSSRKVGKNAGSLLEKPRTLLTLEQRNKPRVKAGAFDHASIPNYKNPYPDPHIDHKFKAYES
ncbi:unnamed protein product [Chilo suppressalis]|uniref:Uncharacterized protein n=1 Tax=Chilo suppressalis TaxID=168631 RepID=A0ABN8B9K4_CHISP|nr:unnamed protein product [Chilo suppressalis]